MAVDHLDTAVLNSFLESLTILSVADTMYGMPTMSSWLLLDSLHQNLVGRATDCITFTPVQMVDTSTSHTTKPATWFDKNNARPLFVSGQRCHYATGCAAVHTDVYLVMRSLCSRGVLADRQSCQNNIRCDEIFIRNVPCFECLFKQPQTPFAARVSETHWLVRHQ